MAYRLLAFAQDGDPAAEVHPDRAECSQAESSK